MGTLNFKSREAYRRWLAHGHIRGEFVKVPGNQTVTIAGIPHKVDHKR